MKKFALLILFAFYGCEPADMTPPVPPKFPYGTIVNMKTANRQGFVKYINYGEYGVQYFDELGQTQVVWLPESMLEKVE